MASLSILGSCLSAQLEATAPPSWPTSACLSFLLVLLGPPGCLPDPRWWYFGVTPAGHLKGRAAETFPHFSWTCLWLIANMVLNPGAKPGWGWVRLQVLQGLFQQLCCHSSCAVYQRRLLSASEAWIRASTPIGAMHSGKKVLTKSVN